MRNTARDKQTLAAFIPDIVGQVIELTWSYSVWWALASRSSREKFEEVMSEYPNYFNASIVLFQMGFFVTAHRLFDYEKSSISLRSLIDSLASFNPTRAAALQKKLQEDEIRLQKVLRLRHNVHAHRSGSISPTDEYARVKFKPPDMKAVLQLAQELTIELAIELGHPNSIALADRFERCERDVRDETLMILTSLK